MLSIWGLCYAHSLPALFDASCIVVVAPVAPIAAATARIVVVSADDKISNCEMCFRLLHMYSSSVMPATALDRHSCIQ
jgi:hypothetical protein